MPKLAKKYLNDTLDQVRKMFLLGGSGSLLIFILLVTFISIYIERREVAQLVKNDEKEIENTMEGFFNKIIPQSTIEHFNKTDTILLILVILVGGGVIAVICVVILFFIFRGIFESLPGTVDETKQAADAAAHAAKHAANIALAKQAAAAKRAAAT